jgi:hypothetical protein
VLPNFDNPIFCFVSSDNFFPFQKLGLPVPAIDNLLRVSCEAIFPVLITESFLRVSSDTSFFILLQSCNLVTLFVVKSKKRRNCVWEQERAN